jgi:hypothetical protein
MVDNSTTISFTIMARASLLKHAGDGVDVGVNGNGRGNRVGFGAASRVYGQHDILHIGLGFGIGLLVLLVGRYILSAHFFPTIRIKNSSGR